MIYSCKSIFWDTGRFAYSSSWQLLIGTWQMIQNWLQICHYKGPANECCWSSIVFGLSVRPSVRGHSNSVIFNQISSKFHISIASSNLSFKFEYRFCPTSDNQDGRQNDCHLSISAFVVTLTQSFLIGLLPNIIYGLLPSYSRSSSNTGFVWHPITKMADKMVATYQYLLLWSL